MQSSRIFIAASAAVLASSCAAFAAPINYQEQFEGDLPFRDPLPVFTLDVGQNLIAGTLTLTNTVEDFDSFAFVVPAGMAVSGGGIVMNDNFGDFQQANWHLDAGSSMYGAGTLVNQFQLTSPGSATIPALTAGTYNFSNTLIGGNGAPSAGDYVFTLNVVRVPEPTSLALIALGGAALLRRRR